MARLCVLGVCNIGCKKAYFLEPVKAYHDHQNSAQEWERPNNKSLDELIASRGTTHHLRNGSFRRELSQNIIISEI